MPPVIPTLMCPVRTAAGRLGPCLVLSLWLTGCAEMPQETAPLTGMPPPTPSAAPRTTVPTASTETPRPTYRGPWEDPSNPLYQRTIYFDYDSAEIKPQYLDVIRTHSAYLGTTPAQRVTLEGNTDERGTREYNLALGDQRAESVRKLMLAEGVTTGQMATLSYGEEKPAEPGHSENAWRLSRRVIIQY
ncbi:peptidoglycan-associated lipoprotein Pal [uncultured Thiodictyon sp.]|uniref:peptidoglycan-associated lipoprotein Pal n=1 Tax=uncultured Thiodictyon sp. TaxID=1846217 RepID=UPI0025D9D350|nr:peptidoglycan-associated lipoprotein Pal [uncultured Thiodictyon sp.]